VTTTMECVTTPDKDNPIDAPPPESVRSNLLDRINDMWQ